MRGILPQGPGESPAGLTLSSGLCPQGGRLGGSGRELRNTHFNKRSGESGPGGSLHLHTGKRYSALGLPFC